MKFRYLHSTINHVQCICTKALLAISNSNYILCLELFIFFKFVSSVITHICISFTCTALITLIHVKSLSVLLLVASIWLATCFFSFLPVFPSKHALTFSSSMFLLVFCSFFTQSYYSFFFVWQLDTLLHIFCSLLLLSLLLHPGIFFQLSSVEIYSKPHPWQRWWQTF